jgi:hypothetical protein
MLAGNTSKHLEAHEGIACDHVAKPVGVYIVFNEPEIFKGLSRAGLNGNFGVSEVLSPGVQTF